MVNFEFTAQLALCFVWTGCYLLRNNFRSIYEPSPPLKFTINAYYLFVYSMVVVMCSAISQSTTQSLCIPMPGAVLQHYHHSQKIAAQPKDLYNALTVIALWGALVVQGGRLSASVAELIDVEPIIVGSLVYIE